MNKLLFYFLLPLILFVSACIGDDFIDDKVDPVIRITNAIDTMELNSSYQFEYMYLNDVGMQVEISPVWSSSDTELLEISSDGLATAKELGEVSVTISNQNTTEIYPIVISESATTEVEKEKQGSIRTTSSYKLEGDFIFTETESGVGISFKDNYTASSALPGLYLYLSNNKNSIANAHVVDRVTVFNGAHSYSVPDIQFNDFTYLLYYCKPFNVKVGDGELK